MDFKTFLYFNRLKDYSKTKKTMKKIMDIFRVTTLGITLIASSSLFSQTLDPTNMRPGESVEYCRTHTHHAELMNNPAYAVQYQLDQQLLANAEIANEGSRGVIYTIPVVFHILHNGGPENISDEQILDALAILNRDYRLQNTDANNVHLDFRASNPNAYSVPTDVEVEFVLATKAPNGACFNGITRTQSPLSFVTASNQGTNQVQAIVNGNNVFNGQWAGNRYLNIFVCGGIGGAAGYTYTPNGWIGTGMGNGIWILHSYTGSIGTSNPTSGRALTHEVGHWLNLQHTWGPNNNPGNASSCSDDDGVTDTPRCIGLTSCNLNANTCNDLNGANNIFPVDVRDNTENYMDYSYCSKMFTAGQAQRMRTALNSTVGGRNNLWKLANLTLTGADGNTYLCKANFTSNATSVCVGSEVSFEDLSYNNASGWTWSFPGGLPATSTAQNPTVIYNTPGTFAVTLTATDGSVSDEVIKTAYITVLPESATLPFIEDFESYATTNDVGYQIFSSANNATWELTNTAGHTGTQSMKLNNFAQTGTNTDEFTSEPIDLSSISSPSGVTLSFRYAYRKKTTANSETLKVFITNDCGETWVQRRTISGTTLSSLTSSSAWTPTPSDWTTVHMTNVTSSYWVENFRYKFAFDGSGGNNIYIDNINIYKGGPSELSADNLSDFQDLTLFPNPTEGELNVSFDSPKAQKMEIQLIDMTGKVLQTQYVQAAAGGNLVMLSTTDFAPGLYMMRIGSESNANVMQFVVK
jgi:PKD repeat protein